MFKGMNMAIKNLLLLFGFLAFPAFAAEAVPGAPIANDGAKAPYGRHGVVHETRKSGSEQCRRERQARREKMCAQNPEKCREMKARKA